jgi:transposase
LSGITVAQGRQRLHRYLALALEGDDASSLTLSTRIHLLIDDMRGQWSELDRRITAFDAEFVAAARSDATARRLVTIPGIGVLNATALIAAVGDARSFARARDLAAWLGLVPRQATTGGRPRLLGITKRGNKYLRTLLIHAARAALPSLVTTEGPLGNWLRGLSARAHRNTVIVALASKLARIALAVLRSTATYSATIGGRAGAV